MNYDEFINAYLGKGFDYDGVAGVQCVDLIKMYLDKVFNIKAGTWGNAKDYYENFDKLPLKDSFTRIANTPEFVPQKGDIVVWGTDLGNKYGHIAIATGEGDITQFYSYDLNWGSKVVHKVLHNYNGFLGVLRAIDQTKITGVPLRYKTHIQDIGWTDWQNTGETAGTVGEGKRVEAIILEGNNSLDLSYRVHIEDIGWTDFVSNGQIAGTTGQSKRIEAVEIKSNKALSVEEHIQNVGWMPKSQGTEILIGTVGKSLRLEAFKINVL